MGTMTDLSKLLGPHTKPTARGWVNYCHKRCGDKKFRLGINLRYTPARVLCYNCGLRTTLDQLLPGLKGEIAPPEAAPTPPPPTDLPWRPIRGGTDKPRVLEAQALAYLASRGIPRAQAVRLRLGYGIKGYWMGRVIHPYFDHRGEVAGWQGRLLYDPESGDGARKIRFATRRDLPAKYTLLTPATGALYFGGTPKPGGPVLLVEGPYDAIHAQRVIDAYGLFGSNLAEAQAMRILALHPSAIYIGLDRDKCGRSWNKDAKRWEPDPRIKMARMLYARSGGTKPIYIVEYPAAFEGDFGGRADKTPHTREELLTPLAAAWRWRPGQARAA